MNPWTPGGGEEGEGEMYGDSNMEIHNNMWDRWATGIRCMTRGSESGALRQAGGWDVEGGPGAKGHGCAYGWFLFMNDRKPQNSVKQLAFN